MFAAALLLLAAVSVADPAIPLDYVLIRTDAILSTDPRLGRDLGAVDSVADCAALCSRDAHCESLMFSTSSCVLYTVRACQAGGLIQSSKGGLVLEKAASVAISNDRVLLQDSACARYENGTVLDSYSGNVKATFDDTMNAAVADFTTACRAHCAKTTFCQSYTVESSWDAVPVELDLHCTAYSTSVYSGDGSAVQFAECDRRQLSYGIVGAAFSRPNCGHPLRTPPLTGPAGTPAGYALVARNEFIDADAVADVFGALSSASCAALCDRDPTCEAFVYSDKAQNCQLYSVRHCMVAYSSLNGPWTFYGDVFERVNSVTVPADRIIFDTNCGEYRGVQIGSADVSNVTDQDRACRQLCFTTTSEFACQSWEVQALAPLNATCLLFADSLFRTSPLGGYYSTRRGLCAATAPWPHSTYGLVAPATSVLNCGRTPRPSPNKGGGGGDASLPPKKPAPGPAPPPAAPTPAPVREAGAIPSPPNHDAESSSRSSAFSSALVLLVGVVLGLVLV